MTETPVEYYNIENLPTETWYMHEPHCLLHERNAQRHLRTKMHLVLHERRDEAGGEADDLGLVVRDVELEVLDELDKDRLHLNNATER